MSDVSMRPARADDCPAIAELYRMAAGGVADYIWQSLAEPGESVRDAGAKRFRREGENFSYQHCLVVEGGDEIVAMVHAYPMRAVSEVPDDIDPVLRPFCELESAPGLYIAGIACRPAWRGKGIGTRLLEKTRRRAMSEDLPELSLIAFEENAASVRLYEREGFAIVARRAVPTHPLFQYGGDCVLMVAPL